MWRSGGSTVTQGALLYVAKSSYPSVCTPLAAGAFVQGQSVGPRFLGDPRVSMTPRRILILTMTRITRACQHVSSVNDRRFAGVASATAGPAGSADAASRMVSSLAAVCEQLVQDVCDDEECYQAHFPAECQISLPAISCRSGGLLIRQMVLSEG